MFQNESNQGFGFGGSTFRLGFARPKKEWGAADIECGCVRIETRENTRREERRVQKHNMCGWHAIWVRSVRGRPPLLVGVIFPDEISGVLQGRCSASSWVRQGAGVEHRGTHILSEAAPHRPRNRPLG